MATYLPNSFLGYSFLLLPFLSSIIPLFCGIHLCLSSAANNGVGGGGGTEEAAGRRGLAGAGGGVGPGCGVLFCMCCVQANPDFFFFSGTTGVQAQQNIFLLHNLC
jgi:hypothetical protein